MSGEKFTKDLLAPVSPVAVFQLVQAGWPLDAIFAIAVKSVNGLHAASHLQLVKQEADPNYYRVVRLMRELQLTNGVSLRVLVPAAESDDEDEKPKAEQAILDFDRRNLGEAGGSMIAT